MISITSKAVNDLLQVHVRTSQLCNTYTVVQTKRKPTTKAACEKEEKRGGQERSGTNICSSSSSQHIMVMVAVPAAQIKGRASTTPGYEHKCTHTHIHTEFAVAAVVRLILSGKLTRTLSSLRLLGNVRGELCWRHHSTYMYKPVSLSVRVHACVCHTSWEPTSDVVKMNH